MSALSLHYSYSNARIAHPIVSLNGRLTRPRPLIPVTLIGPKGSVSQNALLDTGADDTLFSETVAAGIGIDLTNAPQGRGAGVGGAPVTIRYAEVTLRLAIQQMRREWQGWVGFTTVVSRYPLLGYSGFLQYFDATFLGAHEQVELSINHTYPGT